MYSSSEFNIEVLMDASDVQMRQGWVMADKVCVLMESSILLRRYLFVELSESGAYKFPCLLSDCGHLFQTKRIYVCVI